MRFFWLFCALGALWGCRQVSEPSGQAIALYYSTYQGAKTESLTVGEEVAVFACPEGTEDYFLEAAKFTVGADGRSLTYGSTVYYPDPKQAVRFLAYFPYHTGTFSVPADQSSATALKQADLCGAVARTTPVATPVALAFEHLMARLVVQTNKPTMKISFPNAVASGVLHAATAELVLADTRSEVWTTGNELIVPVQPLSRLVLTVSGIEYVFDGSVSLEAGKTTTLDLTLHPDTHTATLSGSSVTDWGSVNGEGNPTHAVSNTLTLHWPSLPQGTTPDQVIFTIGGTDYAVSNGITYANYTFTVPFTSSVLRYPYTISKIRFYQSNHLVQSCPQLLGSMIYKSGYSTVGVNPNAVKIGNLWWATGNLVASKAAAGEQGLGGCRIGEPMDGGLYFQFGSLIGYKGGALANGGTGLGSNPHIGDGIQWWGGATAWSWANDAMVWPNAMTKTPTVWPTNTGSAVGDRNTVEDQWFFNYNVAPYSKRGQDVREFSTPFEGDAGTGDLSTGRYAVWGIGDPCTYYLGGTWRLPTSTELISITGVTDGGWIPWITAGVTGRWATANQTFNNITGPGAWFGTSLGAGSGTPTVTNPFFPASKYRDSSNGSFYTVIEYGHVWSSSIYYAGDGLYLHFNNNWMHPRHGSFRSHAFPVRCVSSVAP